jgi:hypothetical protein
MPKVVKKALDSHKMGPKMAGKKATCLGMRMEMTKPMSAMLMKVKLSQ